MADRCPNCIVFENGTTIQCENHLDADSPKIYRFLTPLQTDGFFTKLARGEED